MASFETDAFPWSLVPFLWSGLCSHQPSWDVTGRDLQAGLIGLEGVVGLGERGGNRGETEMRLAEEGTKGARARMGRRMEGSGDGVGGGLIDVIGRNTSKETDPDKCHRATETGAGSPRSLFPSFLHFVLSSSQQTHIISSPSDTALWFLKRQT